MHKPLIKICGIRDATTAQYTAELGADFIGMVFYPPSHRHVSVQQAARIAEAVSNSNTTPVGVFVNQTVEEIVAICRQVRIIHVQLHGSAVREALALLPTDFRKLYVQPVSPQGYYDPACIPELSDQDFLLFDNQQPGKGLPFDWKSFQYSGGLRMGLAGGLNASNVGIAIRQFHPALVDVSGGVENASGDKDPHLIKEFIKTVTGVCYD